MGCWFASGCFSEWLEGIILFQEYPFFFLLIAVSLLLHVSDWQGHVAILYYFPLSFSFLFFPSDKCLLEEGSPEFRPCTGCRVTQGTGQTGVLPLEAVIFL